MSNEVQFDFDEEQRQEYNSAGSKLVKVVIKLSGGRVDEAQANYILLGLVALVLLVSAYLFFGSGSSKETLLEQQRLYPPGSPALR